MPVMRGASIILAVLPLLSGCIVGTVASTAVDVVTLPVKAVSAGVDAVTTSQKEADEKRGREARKQDEERGKQVRLAGERCRKGKPLPTDNCAAVAQR
jgi:isocitrate lyase